MSQKHLYKGLSAEVRAQLKADAAGRCVICGGNRPLVIDHCRKSGYVRHPICEGCNIGLGVFREHPGVMKRAIAYLLFFAERDSVDLLSS